MVLLLFVGALLAPGIGPGAAERVRILAFGDSLTAGYGLRDEDSFPSQLERALRAAGHPAEVINAGVSGDTTTGGRARLDWALQDDLDLVIVELGANDGLRGIDPELTRANLATILDKLKQRGVAVLLAGMYAPPNLGADFVRRFNRIYPELASEHGVALYPFFLEGVAAVSALNQADGIHPTAEGIGIIVRRILPHVTALLEP